MAYSVDADLIEIRPNILNLGVANWSNKHNEAYAIINRGLIYKWYKVVAYGMGVDWRSVEFNPNMVEDGQLTRLSCYKTLELAYLFLMKDSKESDGFEREMGLFEKKYNNEWKELLALGISYDWNADDSISSVDEKYIQGRRELVRC